ncbi:hypothetical protein H920_11786 [Fukomys damarensis]|uniref:Uncharacterized protein n=1 Tax=Fukomys damarensis TaxID=885580 RepID=A0A091DVI8_FUKDA|nr:hypothetical protein H920_11786 [Fukomys damarensis]
MASPCSGDCSPEGLPPPPVTTPASGPAAPQEPRFPDIYGGDKELWEAHFCGIRRAYRALGKEDDFAIRVLTEDFTLPFPGAGALDPGWGDCLIIVTMACVQQVLN